MEKEAKIKLYRDRFSSLIEDRMINQFDPEFDVKIFPESSNVHLIQCFADWTETEEKGSFWLDIMTLHMGKVPTDAKIKKVFKKHKIELP